MECTVEYFIKKFELISDELWCVNYLTHPDNPHQHCARGHCNGMSFNHSLEDQELIDIFGGMDSGNYFIVSNVNNGKRGYELYETTPKRRILKALREIQAGTFRKSSKEKTNEI